MRRIAGFLREWLERRKRVTDETQFHLEQAEMTWIARGLSNRRAHRAAWRDFGKARAQRLALREAGGDLAGLVALFHAHQVSASAWLWPFLGASVVATLILISPDCLTLVQSLVGHGRVMRQTPVMGPAQAIWTCIVVLSLLATTDFLSHIPSKTWLTYGAMTLGLHGLVSMMAWGVGMQFWNQIRWRNDGWAVSVFIVVFGVYAAVSWLQYQAWWRDLRRRCPVCLERLRLPLTEGTLDRVLLGSSSTEWVCIHGHGVLTESRWLRSFRPEDSSLERLISA